MAKKILLVVFFSLFIIHIPLAAKAEDEPSVEIVVQKGDYLIKIAEAHLDNPRKWMPLARINRLKNPDLIYPGQIITIPARLLKGKEAEGVVNFLQGNVLFQTRDSAEWKPLFLNDRIKEGCKIRTDNESGVEITFEDGNSFLQRSNSTLGITTAREKMNSYFMYQLFLQTGRTITYIRKATGQESRFEIDTPSGICAARGTMFRTSVDADDSMRSEVLEGSVYVEATKQKVRVDAGEGTIVRKGEPPRQPRKLLPPPSPVHVKPVYKKFPVLLAFEKAEGAVAFRILLAKDKNFKNILREKAINPAESFDVPGIEDGIYYLEAWSIDDLGLEGLPSVPQVVKIRIHPVPPFIESPVDKGTYRKKSLKLKWLKVDDAVMYHVQIAEDREFSQTVEDKDDIKDTWHETANLDFKTYYFRISSIAEDGYQGEWSDTVSFTLSPVPAVEVPEVDKKEIRIRWQDLGEGMSYHFQMSGEKEFKNILVEKTVDKPFITLPRPKHPGIYYVRVSPVDSKGVEGDFSEPQSFEIKRSLLAEFIGIAGTLGAIFFLIQ